MCLDKPESVPNDLNPTFLFTWKGIRLHTEQNYHSHDFAELAFILSGHGQYRIDNTVYAVREGDLLLLNPGAKHQAVVSDAEHPMTEFFIGFHDFRLPGLPPSFLHPADTPPVLSASSELKQRIFRISFAMDTENNSLLPGRYIMMKSYLLQLLTLVLRESATSAEGQVSYSFESTGKKYLVEQIIDYFEEHYSEKISLDRIADNMYLSPFYISKIFKSETGDAPIHYLIDVRMEKARDILISCQDLSIREVAGLVGYEDAYHFSKLFKKKFGIAPSEIRKSG